MSYGKKPEEMVTFRVSKVALDAGHVFKDVQRGANDEITRFVAEEGDEITMPARYYKPFMGEKVGGGGEKAYEELTNKQLQDELKARDLDTSGNKADLVKRLKEDDVGSSPEAEG